MSSLGKLRVDDSSFDGNTTIEACVTKRREKPCSKRSRVMNASNAS